MAHAPDDELLSAMLDGEPAPGDTAHVADCDDCQARLSELRRAAVALATPVAPPPGHLREAAVREALLVADDASRGPGRVLSFRRRAASATAPRQQRRNPLAAAAALLVAVLVGGWALSMVGDGGGSDVTTFASSASTAAADLAAGVPLLESGSGAQAGPYEAGEVGIVDDINALAALANTDLQQPDEVVNAKRMQTPSPCPYAEGGHSLWQATLTYQGRSAVAHYITSGDKRVMRILAAEDCSLIASQDF